MAVPLLANNLCTSLRKQVARESRLKRALFASAKNFSLNLQRVAPEAGLWLAEKILFRRITKSMLGTEVKCIILGGSHTPQEQLKLLNALGYYTVCGFGMTETAVTSVEMSKRLKKRVSGSVGKPLRSVEYRLKDQEKQPGSPGRNAGAGQNRSHRPPARRPDAPAGHAGGRLVPHRRHRPAEAWRPGVCGGPQQGGHHQRNPAKTYTRTSWRRPSPGWKAYISTRCWA